MNAEPRYFHVSYSWWSPDGSVGGGDAAICSPDGRPVSRTLVNAWREGIIQAVKSDRGLTDCSVSITGWCEYESGEGWEQ